uniref:Secreted protein n=1 Tax=Trypanosoma vivax (strain Y486) TaxID=1055687 RepID=G0UCT3_TRYVY|nr:hypothetical protein TVY486_1111270 [Trypanosoma vivax Y486]
MLVYFLALSCNSAITEAIMSPSAAPLCCGTFHCVCASTVLFYQHVTLTRWVSSCIISHNFLSFDLFAYFTSSHAATCGLLLLLLRYAVWPARSGCGINRKSILRTVRVYS